jgi:hypothetical protein
MPRAIALLLLPLLLRSSLAWAAHPEWESLRGRPINEIRILAREIFDPQRPDESHAIYSWANALHIRTRESVIRRELLFREGEAFEPLEAEESERNLRSMGIFQDVLLEVEALDSGVRVDVHTSDRWSTKVIANISKEGDIFRFRLGLENSNFLGRATQLGGSIVASNDVNAAEFSFFDPRLLGSRWFGGYRYGEDDLAILNAARVGRPYYSELVKSTSDLVYRSVRGLRRVFVSGSILADTLDVDETLGEAFVALHRHALTRSRWGLLYSRRSVTRDIEEQQGSVALTWALLRRGFRQFHNVDRFGTSEDVGAGWSLQLGAGADLRALGADSDRPLWRIDASWARFMGSSTLLALQLRHHGFAHDRELENSRIVAESFGFWQRGPSHSFAWSLGGVAFIREPDYLRFELGGDQRLRGYPARHQAGTRAVWLNLEERLFTNLRLFFVRFGGALFLDVAHAWEDDETFDWRGFDVGGGIGLRIGNNKSGAGVTRIDFAFGRNSFEISLAGGSFFRVARGLTYPAPNLVR